MDWWFAYKAPRLAKDATSVSATGYEYAYYDPVVGACARSPHVMGDGRGALDLTLADPSASVGWLMYNDEMPASAERRDNSSLGHSKGFIAFDVASNTALWLLHSWPKYVDVGATGMPTPMYGQTFVCISLTLKMASDIATQMAQCQQPQVYAPRVPASLDRNDPLFALSQSVNPNTLGAYSVDVYQSIGGLTFKVIAKNRNWDKDFWNDLVGPQLGADMCDETWIRGKIPPTLDSDNVHHTYDIKYIDLHPLGCPWVWPETHDHAKWGITLTPDWVCVGDVNRMVSQEKRGGGTIALQDPALWAALSRTDLLIPPPNHTIEDAKARIKSTHLQTTGTTTSRSSCRPILEKRYRQSVRALCSFAL